MRKREKTLYLLLSHLVYQNLKKHNIDLDRHVLKENVGQFPYRIPSWVGKSEA